MSQQYRTSSQQQQQQQRVKKKEEDPADFMRLVRCPALSSRNFMLTMLTV